MKYYIRATYTCGKTQLWVGGFDTEEEATKAGINAMCFWKGIESFKVVMI